MRNILLLYLLIATSCLTAQNVIFSEDFNANLPSNWSAIEVQGNRSAGSNWTWTNFGPTGELAIEAIKSTTSNNGWMVFDSDLNCSERNQEAWLIAPKLSAANLTNVFLNFESFYRSFNDRPSVEISTDSVNWTTIELFPNLEANDFGNGTVDDNPERFNLDISDLVAGRSNFWFAFRFLSNNSTNNGGGNLVGCAYAWQIDDVSVSDGDVRPDDDLGISSSFFAVAPNALTPASQVDGIGFMANIENLGVQDQTNATLNIQIKDANTDEVLFSENTVIDFIGVDSTAERIGFENAYLPDDFPSLYEGTYTISPSNQDANLQNNQRSFFFGVTDTIFSKWLEEAGDEISPAADIDYAYGNCYYIPKGSGFYARYVTFGITNINDLIGRTVNILTYKWEGDEDNDLFADPEEYGAEPLVFNTYTITGGEGSTITVPVSDEQISLPLEDDAYYFTVIQYSATDDQPMFMSASTEYDYFGMLVESGLAGSPRYASILDVGNTGIYDLIAFGFDIVPVVDISVSDNPDLLAKTAPSLSKDNKITAFPTPADEFITLDFNLVNAQDVEIQFLDIRGRLVQSKQLVNLHKNKFTFPLDEFAKGTYFIYIKAEEGTRTLKIVVQ